MCAGECAIPGEFTGVKNPCLYMLLPMAVSPLMHRSVNGPQWCRQMPDVLNMRLMSMSYGGWDTHNNEYLNIGNNLDV